MDENCNIKNFINKKCKNIKKENNIKSIDEYITEIKNLIINGEMDSLIFDILNDKKDFIIIEDDIVFQLTSSYNQNNKLNNNLSTLYLGECENILKSTYNLSNDDSLLIFKIEYHLKELLIPILEYEIFDPNKKQSLNLSFCDKSKIQISLPINIKEEESFIYDPNSDFYNDKCSTYTTINNTDIILNDRRNEYNSKKLALCEINCEYQGFDKETKKALCECEIKKQIDLFSTILDEKDKLIYKFVNIDEMINIDLMKCYYIFFKKEGLLYNIGSYIILSIIIFYNISSIIFYIKGYDLLKKEINNIIKYIKNKFNNQNTNSLDNDKIFKTKNLNKNKKRKKSKNNINKKSNIMINKNDKNKDIKLIKNYPPKKKVKIKKNRNIYIKNINIINTTENSNKSYSKNELKNLNNFSNLKHEKKLDISALNNKNNTNNKNNNNTKQNSVFSYNDFELNNMVYENALKYDNRSYFEYYISLLKTKHLILFTFFLYNDYNSIIIKLCLFFFSFSVFYAINALFFNDSILHEIYEEGGKFNFIFQLPQMIYSSLITYMIISLIKYLSLSEKNILGLKYSKNINELNIKIPKLYKLLKIKFISFFIISLLFLILFWYYLGCFCAVYKNTQIYLLKDTSISLGISLLYPLGFNLFPGLFRIPALHDNHKNKKFLYKFSKFIALI